MTSRVRATFWGLVVVAVLATGVLSRSIETGDVLGFAITVMAGIMATLAVLLALRILVIIGRYGRSRA